VYGAVGGNPAVVVVVTASVVAVARRAFFEPPPPQLAAAATATTTTPTSQRHDFGRDGVTDIASLDSSSISWRRNLEGRRSDSCDPGVLKAPDGRMHRS
jgi:hypothetical protein